MSDEQYQQLLSDSRSYLNTQFDLLRLRLLEKLSRIIGLVLLLCIAFRRKWFINPIVGALSGILFSEPASHEEKEVHHA